jgi:hypothetical protein
MLSPEMTGAFQAASARRAKTPTRYGYAKRTQPVFSAPQDVVPSPAAAFTRVPQAASASSAAMTPIEQAITAATTAASAGTAAPATPTSDRTAQAQWGPLAWVLPVATTLLGSVLGSKSGGQAQGALAGEEATANLGYEQLVKYYLPLLQQAQEFLTQWNDPAKQRALIGQAEEAAYPSLQQGLAKVGTEFTRRGEGMSSFEALARGGVIGDWSKSLGEFRRNLTMQQGDELMKRLSFLGELVRGIYQPLQGLGAEYGQLAQTYGAQQSATINALLNAVNAYIQSSKGTAGAGGGGADYSWLGSSWATSPQSVTLGG